MSRKRTPVVADALPGMEIERPVPRSAQTLMAEWLAHCQSRPPDRIVKHTGREVRLLLAEGIAYDTVRAGMARWHRRAMHPSSLPSCVNEVLQRGATWEVGTAGLSRSTADERVGQALALAAHYAEIEAREITA